MFENVFLIILCFKVKNKDNTDMFLERVIKHRLNTIDIINTKGTKLSFYFKLSLRPIPVLGILF